MKVFLAVASLRHEGCFFSVAGLPKLASEQACDGEETMGEALANASGYIRFLSQESPNPSPLFGALDISRGPIIHNWLERFITQGK
ncbi:hypothetical protein [Prevotella lacticifex]|uniref:hypothetical protein n=1 Tax=Prevotella lacticifex TaxID=2854755 RepID=UPI001CC45477|nr:hypothetical protein [Prevotella lacticifex]